LFRDKHHNRAIQNIGGTANVTYLPANCRLNDIIAFDTGPGNMVIDGITSILSEGEQNYDREGKLAARGVVDNTVLNDMLKHPFFKRKPPKSTGREEFGQKYCDAFYRKVVKKSLPAENIMATVTALTAVSIAQAYRRFLPQMPDEIILTGGGTHNTTLVEILRQQLDGRKIMLSDNFGINCDAKEAISFAILAFATIKGISNNVPSATGAKQPLVLGKIIPA
jgi:anhydro-N-acetylmuramic acid kinase